MQYSNLQPHNGVLPIEKKLILYTVPCVAILKGYTILLWYFKEGFKCVLTVEQPDRPWVVPLRLFYR